MDYNESLAKVGLWLATLVLFAIAVGWVVDFLRGWRNGTRQTDSWMKDVWLDLRDYVKGGYRD